MIICKRPVHPDDHLQLLFIVFLCLSFVFLSFFVLHRSSFFAARHLYLFVVVCRGSLFVVYQCVSFVVVC